MVDSPLGPCLARSFCTLLRWRHQRGTMPSTPTTKPPVKAISTSTINGVCHFVLVIQRECEEGKKNGCLQYPPKQP
jgi:hypothetical protein